MNAPLDWAAAVHAAVYFILSVLGGVSLSTIAPLQRVQNAVARLVLSLSRSDHVRPALVELLAARSVQNKV